MESKYVRIRWIGPNYIWSCFSERSDFHLHPQNIHSTFPYNLWNLETEISECGIFQVRACIVVTQSSTHTKHRGISQKGEQLWISWLNNWQEGKKTFYLALCEQTKCRPLQCNWASVDVGRTFGKKTRHPFPLYALNYFAQGKLVKYSYGTKEPSGRQEMAIFEVL